MKTYIQLIILFIIANSFGQNPVPFDTIYNQNIMATKSHLGQYGKVTLQIDDAGHDGLITKPLIVAEGFDPGIIFEPESTNGMNTYKSFMTSVFEGGNDLRNLITGSSITNSGDQEYDIIYVNWDNGVDYLQRNAYALEEVIKWVNEQKAEAGSTTPNVVLGQSMGGVIARYALADMEQNSLVHDTRLFVSHDAPQQGANIPVSVQYMFRHLTSLYNEFSTPFGIEVISLPLLENSLLDQPATQQMVKNWVATNFEIFYPPHTNFYNELRGKGLANSGGYPINCRNVAISNGSECGISQNFNPGDDLLSFNTNGSLGDILDSLVGFTGFFGTGNEGLLGVGFVSLIPGNSKFRADFNAKSIPYGSGNQIYKGRISYQKKIFKLFGWTPTITVNISNVEKSQPGDVLPFDTYGGGKYETSLFTGDVDLPDGVYIRDSFSFIPTASALDIGKGIVTLNDADYRKQYVGALPPVAPKDSPFENFITDYNSANPNASNSAHISFNPRNGKWLARELTENSIISDCSFLCDLTSISGDEIICTNNVFSVPAGAVSYTWTMSGSSANMVSNGNTATITRTGQMNGSITLQVVIDGGDCGSITLNKEVWVGVPNFNSLQPIGNQTGYNPQEPNISLIDGSQACNGIYLKVVFDSTSPILQYEMEKITTDVNGGLSGAYLQLQPMCNKDFVFKVRARNACGWTPWKQLTYAMSRCMDDCETNDPIVIPNNFTLSPNPVTAGVITANVTSNAPWYNQQSGGVNPYPDEPEDPNNPSLPDDPGLGDGNGGGLPPLQLVRANITVLNQLGVVVLSYPNSSFPKTIDLGNLATGNYVVLFEYQGQTESHTLIKY